MADTTTQGMRLFSSSARMTIQYGCLINGAVAVLAIRHTVHLIDSTKPSLRSQAPAVPIDVGGHAEWNGLVRRVARLTNRDARRMIGVVREICER